jgi:hypothetical protein
MEPPNPQGPEAPGPIGGYGVGLPPGVSPDAVHGDIAGSPQTEPMAMASFACGMAGVLLSLCCLGLPLGLVAIGLGVAALSRIRPEGPRGKGLAIAGIALGVLGPVLYIGLQLVGFAASFWPP